jgi:hypothetical protein
MKYYREGVPESESPCAVPEVAPVGWLVCGSIRHTKQTRFGTIVVRGRCAVVWTKYAAQARELGARKLSSVDPSVLVVRRIKEQAA